MALVFRIFCVSISWCSCIRFTCIGFLVHLFIRSNCPLWWSGLGVQGVVFPFVFCWWCACVNFSCSSVPGDVSHIIYVSAISFSLWCSCISVSGVGCFFAWCSCSSPGVSFSLLIIVRCPSFTIAVSASRQDSCSSSSSVSSFVFRIFGYVGCPIRPVLS